MTFRQSIATLLISGLFALPTVPVAADNLAGAYLAGRHASMFRDYAAAVEYYSKALITSPKEPMLLEELLVAYIGVGDVDRGLPIADELHEFLPTNQFANMVRVAKAARAGDYAAIVDQPVEDGRGVGPLVDGLVTAWARVGTGQMTEALAEFDKVAAGQGLGPFGLYHKALAFAMVGDFEGADEILSGRSGPRLPLTRRGLMMHAQVLSQLERNPDAVALIDDVFNQDLDPGLTQLRAELAAGKPVPFDMLTDARQGIAEVFYSVASALEGEAEAAYALMYARIAEYIEPGHTDAKLLTATLLERMEQYDLATQAYKSIPREDPSFFAAEMGRAAALRSQDKVDAAIEVLEGLAETHGDLPAIHITLGDTFRSEDRCADAVPSYDKAIVLFKDPDRSQWPIYFARGICHEQLDIWDKAEADFRMALELEPGQPQVLNYLGYSFVEKRTNLDEALAMIEQAVAERPDDGYITDSLGWVYYRLGRYEDAVAPMERATSLMSTDAIVNDHLGDVYWAVDRKREAEFQWRRALSFDPEEKEADRIRRKLEVGLDVVLEEEGAEPLKVTDGN